MWKCFQCAPTQLLITSAFFFLFWLHQSVKVRSEKYIVNAVQNSYARGGLALQRFLRKFLAHKDVRTLVLLMPEVQALLVLALALDM